MASFSTSSDAPGTHLLHLTYNTSILPKVSKQGLLTFFLVLSGPSISVWTQKHGASKACGARSGLVLWHIDDREQYFQGNIIPDFHVCDGLQHISPKL